jgi:hypothetical protein
MTVPGIAELMRAAARRDYDSMAALARALHGAGRAAPEVLRACYGVAFPDELFALAAARAADRAPPALYTNQPWKLAIPLTSGGPPPRSPAIDELEQAALALDPDLIPLLILEGPDFVHGSALLCYRLSELRAGRATIIGLPRDVDGASPPRRHGDSLLGVLHEHFADAVRRLDKEFQGPYNRGAGALDEVELRGAHADLARIDALVHAQPAGS